MELSLQLQEIQRKKNVVFQSLKKDIQQMEQNLAMNPLKNVQRYSHLISKSLMMQQPLVYFKEMDKQLIPLDIISNGKLHGNNKNQEIKKPQKIDIEYEKDNQKLDQEMDQTLLKYQSLMLNRQQILNNIHKISKPLDNMANFREKSKQFTQQHQQQIQLLLRQKKHLSQQLSYAKKYIEYMQQKRPINNRISDLMRQNQNLRKKVQIYERELLDIRARVEELDHFSINQEERKKEKHMKNIPTFNNLQVFQNSVFNNTQIIQKIQSTLENIFRVYHCQHDEIWEGILTKYMMPNFTLANNIKADIQHLHHIIKEQISKLIKQDLRNMIRDETNHYQINEKMNENEQIIKKLKQQLTQTNKSKNTKNTQVQNQQKIIQLQTQNLQMANVYQQKINKLVLQLERTAINDRQLQHYKQKCKELQNQNLVLEKKYLQLRMLPLNTKKQQIAESIHY